ncbi:MAG: hypothetical protein HYU29_01450 [Chloroflexi bacterium]|nr:hypothetical protein [Chloroflexota bacterium]
MGVLSRRPGRWNKYIRVFCGATALLAALGILVACSQSQPPPPTVVAPTPTGAPVAAPTATPVPLKLLKVQPEKGYIGDSFAITGEGFLPGQGVEFQWATMEGSYLNKAIATDLQFHKRQFTPKRVRLGGVTADAQGKVTASFNALEDFGETREIYAVVDGKDVGKGGFRILRTASITPTEGPVGTPITVTIKGIGWSAFQNTMALRYDNKHMGFISAVTTKGTAVFQIRAAGPVGKHIVQVTGASPTLAYLNLQQSPVGYIPMDFAFEFKVTGDNGPPPVTQVWPDKKYAIIAGSGVPGTMVEKLVTAPGVSAKIEPGRGQVHSRPAVKASGLPPNTEVELRWVTGRGSDSLGVRFLAELPLVKAVTDQQGTLSASFEVTDDRGGWQVVRVVRDSQVFAELAYFVERTDVSVTPTRVKLGEKFTIQLNGVGWTEMDKGVAVTYDNAYIGYACGVSSSGTVVINLVATGGPGTHIIDLWPMIYRQPGEHPPEFWNFQMAQLTGLQDHPALSLGYYQPNVRLAIEVVE